MKQYIKGEITNVVEFQKGGYQDKCSGFEITIATESNFYGYIIDGFEAFNSDEQGLKNLENVKANLFKSFNVSSFEELVGKQVFIKRPKKGKNRFEMIY